MKAFFLVLSIIFRIEGGWTDIDGGTNYGIRAATLARANALKITRAQDIRKLTRREAAAIYYKMFWLPSGANKYSYPLNLVIFDAAVHMGPEKAKKLLAAAQRKTSSSSPRLVATQFLLERHKQLRSLSKYPKYKRGWQKRMRIIGGYVMRSRR
jgi:lysozyme family protein